MKTIQNLLDTGHRVWFYLRDKETEKLFDERKKKLENRS